MRTWRSSSRGLSQRPTLPQVRKNNPCKPSSSPWYRKLEIRERTLSTWRFQRGSISDRAQSHGFLFFMFSNSKKGTNNTIFSLFGRTYEPRIQIQSSLILFGHRWDFIHTTYVRYRRWGKYWGVPSGISKRLGNGSRKGSMPASAELCLFHLGFQRTGREAWSAKCKIYQCLAGTYETSFRGPLLMHAAARGA